MDRLSRSALARCSSCQRDWQSSHYSPCTAAGSGFQPRRLPIQYAPFHFSLWLSHESRQRRNSKQTTWVAGRAQPPRPLNSQIGRSSDGMCHLHVWSAKSANSEAKTEFRLHRYERTTLLRDVATGVHTPARAGVDVPPNRGGSEHFREDGHGMARGARPAPATKRKTPPETSRVSIKDMSGSSRDDFKPGAGWLIPYPPITVPTQALRQG
jgi:hypothetical protein